MRSIISAMRILYHKIRRRGTGKENFSDSSQKQNLPLFDKRQVLLLFSFEQGAQHPAEDLEHRQFRNRLGRHERNCFQHLVAERNRHFT